MATTTILIRTTFDPIRILIRMTVVPIRILIRTTLGGIFARLIKVKFFTLLFNFTHFMILSC